MALWGLYMCVVILKLDQWYRKRWCLKDGIMGTIYVCSYFEIGSVVQEKMVFKRWHYGEYMGVIILILDQWYRKRWCLKDGTMGNICVLGQWYRKRWCLKDGIMGNICM